MVSGLSNAPVLYLSLEKVSDESKSLVGFFSNIPRKFLIVSIEKDFKVHWRKVSK